jgi:hypothetical protein
MGSDGGNGRVGGLSGRTAHALALGRSLVHNCPIAPIAVGHAGPALLQKQSSSFVKQRFGR